MHSCLLRLQSRWLSLGTRTRHGAPKENRSGSGPKSHSWCRGTAPRTQDVLRGDSNNEFLGTPGGGWQNQRPPPPPLGRGDGGCHLSILRTLGSVVFCDVLTHRRTYGCVRGEGADTQLMREDTITPKFKGVAMWHMEDYNTGPSRDWAPVHQRS